MFAHAVLKTQRPFFFIPLKLCARSVVTDSVSIRVIIVSVEQCVMEIQTYSKDNWSVGCPVIVDEITWFKGKDVATSLEYVNARDALNRHVEPEDKTTYGELTKGVGNCRLAPVSHLFPE